MPTSIMYVCTLEAHGFGGGKQTMEILVRLKIAEDQCERHKTDMWKQQAKQQHRQHTRDLLSFVVTKTTYIYIYTCKSRGVHYFITLHAF